MRQAKAIVVAIAKNVAAEAQATASTFVALAFIRASGVKLGQEIAAAIAKSAEDKSGRRSPATGGRDTNRLTPTFDIGRLQNPSYWAMAAGSDGIGRPGDLTSEQAVVRLNYAKIANARVNEMRDLRITRDFRPGSAGRSPCR